MWPCTKLAASAAGAIGYSVCAMALAVWRCVPADAPRRAPAAAPPGPAPAGTSVGWPARLTHTLGAPGPWLAALTFCAYSAQWLAVIGFLPSLYAQLGWGGALGAVLTALVAAANILGNVLAGRLLSAGVAPGRLLWAGFGAMALGAFLAYGAPTQDVAALRYAGALLFSALGGLVPGSLFALAPRLAPSEAAVSTTVGWMMQWSALGQVGGPPLAAWLASRAGGWQFTWVLTGACCVAGAVLAAQIGRRVRLAA